MIGLNVIGVALLGFFSPFFAQLPASTNYELNSYGIGSGGTGGATSSTYSLEAITGEASGTQLSSATYKTNPGFIATQQANVPGAPTFVNSGNWYDKLHITINDGGNPSDAKFAIAISTDDFVSTNYVQSDNTVGPALGTEDYLTYAGWGGASGVDIIGLVSSTTYKVKVKATAGKFSESAYGPIASAATVGRQLSFDIDVSATDSDTSPPYATNLGTLIVNTVVDGPEKIWLDFATNANSGGKIYIYAQNGGLNSAARSYTIASASGDLASLEEGFGAQSASASQSSGGPLAAVSPYNGAAQNVGVIDSLIRDIYSTTAPIVGGRASLLLKAKSKSLTPPATDYSEVITAIASGNY